MTLLWGPTGLILGDPLIKDKAYAADLLRACLCASAYQSADDSSTLQRTREKRESGEIRGHERRTTDENVSARTHRLDTVRVVNSSTGTYVSELPSQGRVVRLSVKTREGKRDAAARAEHGQHPDHDDDISGGQDFAIVDGPGERKRKMDARRVTYGHEASLLPSNQALSRTADGMPEHEQSDPRFPRAQ